MSRNRTLLIGVLLSAGIGIANAGPVTFTCAANIDATAAGTCAYLNSVVAGDYTSTFNNVNANVYIQYGTTGLASSTVGFYNALPYATFVTDLTGNAVASGDPVMNAAVASLNTVDASTYYGTSTVRITSAEGQALGVPLADLTGTTGPAAGSNPCTIGTAGCYNGVITLTNAANTWYYDQNGGIEGTTLYDVYAAVEHEFNEILGTSSCMSTQSGTGLLTDPCDGALGGTGTPSSTDLYRYNSQGNLAFNSSYIGLAGAPAGAYFSYNGGTTNGANGKVYNTLSNGNDYADFTSSCPGGPFAIQDAQGCPGTDQGFNIKKDGNAEINLLNALGYETGARTPEPASMALLAGGFALMAGYRRRRRS
jgi:hypothetical protein